MSKITPFGIHNILFLYKEGDSQGAVSWKLSILQHSVQVEDKRFTTGEKYVKLCQKKKKKNPPDTAPRDAFSPSWSIHDPLSSMKFHPKWFQWKGGCQDMAITTHKSFECPSRRLWVIPEGDFTKVCRKEFRMCWRIKFVGIVQTLFCLIYSNSEYVCRCFN